MLLEQGCLLELISYTTLESFQDDIDRLRHREPLLSLSSEPSSPDENKEKQGAVKFGWIKGVLVSYL